MNLGQTELELRLKNPNKLSLSHLWLCRNRALLCDIRATNYWFVPRTGRSSLSVYSDFIIYSSVNIPYNLHFADNVDF